jgi:hypothetical protein
VGQLLALLVVMRVETIGRLQTCIGSDTFTKLMQLNLRQYAEASSGNFQCRAHAKFFTIKFINLINTFTIG